MRYIFSFHGTTAPSGPQPYLCCMITLRDTPTHTTDRQPYLRWNLDLQAQQASSHRPMPYTVQALGLAISDTKVYIITDKCNSLSLQGQDTVVLDTDWPVQVTLYVHKLIIETLIKYKIIKR